MLLSDFRTFFEYVFKPVYQFIFFFYVSMEKSKEKSHFFFVESLFIIPLQFFKILLPDGTFLICIKIPEVVSAKYFNTRGPNPDDYTPK